MAARPNTYRTLQYGVKIAIAQVARLNKAIAQAENTLGINVLLSDAERVNYKLAIKTCKEQLKMFERSANHTFAMADLAGPKRKPGRPSKASIAAAQSGTFISPVGAPAAKKRGRPAKAKPLAVAPVAAVAAPKRRGRPPSAETVARRLAEAQALVAASAPALVAKKRGRPAKVKPSTALLQDPAAVAVAPKRRGRPPGPATLAKRALEAQALSLTQQAVAAAAAAPKKRGRPAKAKVLNGSSNLSVN